MENWMLTVDTGTTNTRAVLWNARGEAVQVCKSQVGVRDTAVDGNNKRLQQAVRECMQGCLTAQGLDWEQVEAVYASGMITSNVGLVEVPHLTAPSSRSDFAGGVRSVLLEEVCPKPIQFVPGLRNSKEAVSLDNLEAMDIMRGEEVEVIALLEALPPGRPYLFVLPGSHTKFISVDQDGRMTGCLTSIAGELVNSLTNNSILADAVGRRYVDGDYRRAHLLAGYRTAADTSFGRAAFSTRILSQLGGGDAADCANFLLGAVLQGDVDSVKRSRALKTSPGTEVIVAGKEPLRTAFVDLFAEDGYFQNVRVQQAEDGRPMSGYGVWLLANDRKRCYNLKG